MASPITSEWDTDRVCEMLNNTEELMLSAQSCRSAASLRRYVAWLYGSSSDESVKRTRVNVPDLDTVDWDAVLKDVKSE